MISSPAYIPLALALALILSSSVYALPYIDTRGAKQETTSAKKSNQTGSSSHPIFDPTYVEFETQQMTTRYHYAAEILSDQRSVPMDKLPLTSNNDPFIPSSRTGIRIGMRNSQDTFFYSMLGFGSQNQQLKMALDTTSGDTWVPLNCGDCTHNRTDFQDEYSKTFKDTHNPFWTTYWLGETQGMIVQDSVTIENTTVPKFPFGGCSFVLGQRGDPTAGSFGLAFGSLSNTSQPTLFETLMSTGAIKAPYFSMDLTTGVASGSELCLGCANERRVDASTVVWVPLVTQTYWAVSLTSIRIGYIGSGLTNFAPSTVKPKSALLAVFDSLAVMNYFPADVAKSIFAKIPGSKPIEQDDLDSPYGVIDGAGFYSVPCETRATVTLRLADVNVTMDSVNFLLGRVSSKSNNCFSSIVAFQYDIPAQNMVVLGTTFIRQQYTIFDYSHGGRIGLAQRR